MNSKGRRFFLYLLLAVMVVTQVAFTKNGENDTSDESAVNNTEHTDGTENEVQTNANAVIEVKNTSVASASENDGTSYVVIVEEQTEDESEEILLGLDSEKEESDFQDMIVSYADPYLPVRTEATRESETVGKLFPGSYADIIERGEEWTKIQSGNVEGYIQNIYVCFDREAEDLSDQLRGTLSTAVTLAEEKKMQEEAAKKAVEAASKNNSSTASAPTVAASSYEVCLLAAIIDWEANAEPYEGKLAVAYVVLNRVNAGYGGSIQAVLSARGQFGGVTDGNGNWSSRFQERVNKYVNGTYNDCFSAAQDALAGVNNPLNAAYLNFNTVVSSYSQAQQIGSHIFYNH